MFVSRVSRARIPSAVTSNTGQVLVEGVFVLLMFFVVVFAVFEGGMLLQVQNALTDAAREGARRAIAPLTQTSNLPLPDDVRGVVQSYLRAANIIIPDNQILVDPAVVISGTQYTRVTVPYDYKIRTLSMFGMLNMRLTGKSLMRNETSP